MAEKDYFIILGIGDSIRMHIMTDRGEVVDFVVQYETRIGDRYYPVVRYDSSHGRGHRDILDMRGNTIAKHWLPEHMDFNECLAFAEYDVRTNWQRYLGRFIEQ